MGLPVTMFGETKEQRLARLLQAEEDKGHHHDDFNLTDGHNVVSCRCFFAIQAYQHTRCLVETHMVFSGDFRFDLYRQ